MTQMNMPLNQQINLQLSSPMNSQMKTQLSPQVNHNNKFFGGNNNELLSPKSNKESNSDNHINNNMSDSENIYKIYFLKVQFSFIYIFSMPINVGNKCSNKIFYDYNK